MDEEAVPIMRLISDSMEEPKKSNRSPYYFKREPYPTVLAVVNTNGYGGFEGVRSSQVAREVDERLGVKTGSYRGELNRLARDGFVEEVETGPEKNKCKKWKITDEGKKMLEIIRRPSSAQQARTS